MMLTAISSPGINLHEFLVKTVADMRTGRTSWRVMLVLTIPAFVAGIIAGLPV